MKLGAGERERLDTLICTGKHRARQLMKARIPLKADVSEVGEGWSDSQIASMRDFRALVFNFAIGSFVKPTLPPGRMCLKLQ